MCGPSRKRIGSELGRLGRNIRQRLICGCFHKEGSRANQLRNKLVNVKKMALDWNRNVFGRVEVEIRRKQNQLQYLQDSIVTNDDVRRERVYREELEELLDREELLWAQKARTNWFLHRDRNTRYF
nr:hypothetical protein CFP56_76544 [Quercus suber]